MGKRYEEDDFRLRSWRQDDACRFAERCTRQQIRGHEGEAVRRNVRDQGSAGGIRSAAAHGTRRHKDDPVWSASAIVAAAAVSTIVYDNAQQSVRGTAAAAARSTGAAPRKYVRQPVWDDTAARHHPRGYGTVHYEESENFEGEFVVCKAGLLVVMVTPHFLSSSSSLMHIAWNGIHYDSFVGMGMILWEWEGMKTLHFPISSPRIADHQTLLMDTCFCIVICRRWLGFTLDGHETLLALTLHVYFIGYDWFVLFVTVL